MYLFSVCAFVGVCIVCVGVYHSARWSENNLQESVFSYNVDPRDQTWVFNFGGKHPFPKSHLTSPNMILENHKFSNYLICIIIFLTTLNGLIFLMVSIVLLSLNN